MVGKASGSGCYDEQLEALQSAASCIARGDASAARRALEGMKLDIHDPAHLRARLFVNALARHLVVDPTQRPSHNLYLGEHNDTQIDLFNLMGSQFPFITASTIIANQWLLKSMAPGAAVTLVDVGTGTGRQVLALLDALVATPCRLASLEIVGIEAAPQALAVAAEAIERRISAAALPYVVRFTACPGLMEEFSDSQWQALRRPGCTLLVNEGFALHHAHVGATPGQRQADAKQRVLGHIRALDPRLLVLAEPDTDHHTADLASRVANAWRHYGLAFAALDAAIPEYATLLKLQFFGREIADVVGTAETARTERHEREAMWHARLRQAGFQPAQPVRPAKVERATGVTVDQPHGSVGRCLLGYAGQSVVAVLAYVPNPNGRPVG